MKRWSCDIQRRREATRPYRALARRVVSSRAVPEYRRAARRVTINRFIFPHVCIHKKLVLLYGFHEEFKGAYKSNSGQQAKIIIDCTIASRFAWNSNLKRFASEIFWKIRSMHKSMLLFASFTFPWYGKPSLKYLGVYGRNSSFRAWCTTTVRLIVVSTMPVPVSVKLAIRTILFGATFHWASPSTAPDSANSVQPSGESSCDDIDFISFKSIASEIRIALRMCDYIKYFNLICINLYKEYRSYSLRNYLCSDVATWNKYWLVSRPKQLLTSVS